MARAGSAPPIKTGADYSGMMSVVWKEACSYVWMNRKECHQHYTEITRRYSNRFSIWLGWHADIPQTMGLCPCFKAITLNKNHNLGYIGYNEGIMRRFVFRKQRV